MYVCMYVCIYAIVTDITDACRIHTGEVTANRRNRHG